MDTLEWNLLSLSCFQGWAESEEGGLRFSGVDLSALLLLSLFGFGPTSAFGQTAVSVKVMFL